MGSEVAKMAARLRVSATHVFSMHDTLNAFAAFIDRDGAPDGLLRGLRFAAKDLFDVAGHMTGGGNPDWRATHGPAARNAAAVQALLDAGARLVGKTHTDEVSRGIFGENAHHGAPINPRAPGRVTGGSSSGSAAAVAGGLVDFALGTDTGGSVRVPASFCGIYGMRPTLGRVPLDGVVAQAPSYDTVGWFARDSELMGHIGQALYGAPPAGRPNHVVVATDLFEAADADVADALATAVRTVCVTIGSSTEARIGPEGGPAAWAYQQTVLQGMEAWATFRDWIERTNPRFSFEVARNFLTGAGFTEADRAAAIAERDAIRERLSALLRDGTVICLPTVPFVAPLRGEPMTVRAERRARLHAFTCIAGTLGAPQISMPLARLGRLPVGLSLIGAPGSDESLLHFAREIVP